MMAFVDTSGSVHEGIDGHFRGSERTTVETPNQITMRRLLRFVTTKRLPYGDEQEAGGHPLDYRPA
jgi:hypothetical protein